MSSTERAESFPVAEARRLVRDLTVPDPLIYWADFLFHVGLGWGAFVFALRLPSPSVGQALCYVVSALALYRAVIFTHELAHLKRGSFGFFRLVWNAEDSRLERTQWRQSRRQQGGRNLTAGILRQTEPQPILVRPEQRALDGQGPFLDLEKQVFEVEGERVVADRGPVAATAEVERGPEHRDGQDQDLDTKSHRRIRSRPREETTLPRPPGAA